LEEGIILITGANGQIGSALVDALQDRYSRDKVVATDIREPKDMDGRFHLLDVMDAQKLEDFMALYRPRQIYHLAALLSSKGEDDPEFTWRLNFDAYIRLVHTARRYGVERIFFPSTIGVYGPTTPKQNTPQNTSFIPSTVYGISKITAELWNAYFRTRFGMDIRGLRYPGVISHETRPAGGTTDFAVEIFFDAMAHGHYDCYLKPDTRLPMLYMPDVLKATLDLMHADNNRISTGMAYNISGFSVTPAELYEEIRKHLPDMTIRYAPDHRQAIADSWTETIDDSLARHDWHWKADFNMSSMVLDMITNLRSK